MKQKIFALFLILCGLCLNLKAETQGDIVGRVLDDSGAPLAGATVQILHAKGGVTTDEDGYFRIPYSKDGAVRVKVSFVGYQTQTFVLKADEKKGNQHVLRLQPDATAFTSSLHSFYINDVPLIEGYTNVLSNGTNGSVRQFSISRRTKEMEVYSLPAMLYMSAINDTLPSSVKEPEDRMINYVPTRFPVVRYDSIAQKADLIRDHIVLLGTVNEEEDMHYTPLGKMPGLEVQAFSLQTLLSQRDIHVVSEVWLIILAFIFCYLTQFIQYGAVRLVARRTDTVSIFLSGSFLFLRIITFSWLGLLAWLGFILYVKCNIYLAMTWIFAPVVLVAESRGLYSAFVKTLCLKHHDRFKWLKSSLYYVAPEVKTASHDNEELRVESGSADVADVNVTDNDVLTPSSNNS